jgi:hypothetical protein
MNSSLIVRPFSRKTEFLRNEEPKDDTKGKGDMREMVREREVSLS